MHVRLHRGHRNTTVPSASQTSLPQDWQRIGRSPSSFIALPPMSSMPGGVPAAPPSLRRPRRWASCSGASKACRRVGRRRGRGSLGRASRWAWASRRPSKPRTAPSGSLSHLVQVELDVLSNEERLQLVSEASGLRVAGRSATPPRTRRTGTSASWHSRSPSG